MKTHPSVLMAPDAFTNFLAEAHAGCKCLYHTGHLSNDRGDPQDINTGARDTERYTVNQVATLALQAADAGLVALTQRRHGEDDYDYMATRTYKPYTALPAIEETVQMAA
jgi:hypothetical protein